MSRLCAIVNSEIARVELKEFMKILKIALITGLSLVVTLTGARLSSQETQTTRQPAGNSVKEGVETAGKKPSEQAGSANRGSASAGGRGTGGRARPPALVVTAPVTSAIINDRLKAVGNGTASASVSVVPLSGGILAEVLVKPGELVEKDSVLARLDDQEQLIARQRAELAMFEATTDVERLTKLFRSRTATEVELDRAKTALSDAELALRDATLRFDRRTIKAPIKGFVGFVSVDAGNFVSAQTELMTIDDRSTVVVEFWIPARFANDIAVNQTIKALALANPGEPLSGTIIGIGTRVEEDSRTLPVKASIDNRSDSLRPGMSFELNLSFDGDTYPAVNPLAIQWDSKGPYIWRVVDNKVQRVVVNIIQRNTESVLVNAALSADDNVVIEGLLALRDGATVRVQGAGKSGVQAPQAKQNKPQGNESQGNQGSDARPDSKPATTEKDTTS